MLIPFYTALFPRLLKAPVEGHTSITGMGFNGAGMPDIGMNGPSHLLDWLKTRTKYQKHTHTAFTLYYSFMIGNSPVIFNASKNAGTRQWDMIYLYDGILSGHGALTYLKAAETMCTLTD